MNDQAQAAIVADGLTKTFPGICAVDALSFDVHTGEIFGLVGPDGAGKTTTLRMLAGILPPDARERVDRRGGCGAPAGASQALTELHAAALRSI